MNINALLQALKSKVGDYISNGSIPSGVYPINGSTTNVGTVPTSIGNSNLKWETTEQWNVGLDLSFFKERLNFTADIYRKNYARFALRGFSSVDFRFLQCNEEYW